MKQSKNPLIFHQNTQYIAVSHQGVIKETDHTIFSWKVDTSIYDAHPFFEVLKGFIDIFEKEETTYNFPCIHLEEGDTKKICDVTIIMKTDEVVIILFDYTSKYLELNKIAQQKNESILKAKKLDLDNKFLIEKEKLTTPDNYAMKTAQAIFMLCTS